MKWTRILQEPFPGDEGRYHDYVSGDYRISPMTGNRGGTRVCGWHVAFRGWSIFGGDLHASTLRRAKECAEKHAVNNHHNDTSVPS